METVIRVTSKHRARLAGTTATLDALHCQVETARAVLDAEADYVLTVKADQSGLHQTLLDRFIAYGDIDYRVRGRRRHTTVEKSHGRRERREYYFAPAPDDPVLTRWPGMRSIDMIFRLVEDGDAVREEPTFDLTCDCPGYAGADAGFTR